MGHQAALALALLLAGCDPAPEFGEVLIEIDAEPAVPTFLARLRIDLFAPDGTWYESRDIAAPDPADWPLSFSLFTDAAAGKSVRLRARAYPEGGVRDFQGERFTPPLPFVEPPSAHSLAELCSNPPLLPPEQPTKFRRAAAPITAPTVDADCTHPTEAGAVAARIVITESGFYRFEIVNGDPGGAFGDLEGDTTLYLRTNCADPASQLGCADDINATNLLSRLDFALDPGEYFLLTGGRTRLSPADVTLKWARADRFDIPPSVSPAPSPVPDPRDQLQGGSTPSSEPQPNLAIDLVTDVRVEYGKRRTAHLQLRGECLGTQADLRGGLTCIDSAGVRIPVATAGLVDGLQPSATSLVGSWAAAQPTDCTLPPRQATASLLDEEVCVPGGAFTLGNRNIIGLGARDGAPEQPVIVGPMLFDRYEMTVARYRKALADGFVPPLPAGVNDAALTTLPTAVEDPRLCTFSTTPRGREKWPLNCVNWYTARALCQFLGSDLPSHVAWEHAAIGDTRSTYPWGDAVPDCCRVAYGRGGLDYDCKSTPLCGGTGAVAVDGEPWVTNDVSPFGLIGLGGNVTEMVADAFEPYSSSCWWQQPLRGVRCEQAEPPGRSARGGNWAVDSTFARSAIMAWVNSGVGSTAMGFRCARHGVPSP